MSVNKLNQMLVAFEDSYDLESHVCSVLDGYILPTDHCSWLVYVVNVIRRFFYQLAALPTATFPGEI